MRAANATPDNEDSIRTLSPFEVREDQESGYRAANSVTASRFALPIMDTPMSIAVVTEEFLRDIGARDALDSLSYVSGITQGNSPVRLEGSNSFNIRGVQTGFMLRNGVTSYGINDGYNIERWEVLKGIVGMMYGDRTSAASSTLSPPSRNQNPPRRFTRVSTTTIRGASPVASRVRSTKTAPSFSW